MIRDRDSSYGSVKLLWKENGNIKTTTALRKIGWIYQQVERFERSAAIKRLALASQVELRPWVEKF